MWIAFAFGSTFFAGLTSILGKVGISGVVDPIDKLSILVMIAFSYVVFHERFSTKSAAGLTTIILGTIVMTLPPCSDRNLLRIKKVCTENSTHFFTPFWRFYLLFNNRLKAV